MNKEQLDETFGGIVNDKFDTVVGKMIEKDGKYVFEGVSLNKRGQVIGSITYVAGFCTLVYLGAKAGATIGEKIANKIHQRKIMKAKAKAYDEFAEVIKKAEEELIKKHPELADKLNGKHFKDEESE